MLLVLVAAAAIIHPTPQPPPELPASVYQARRDRVLSELGGCVAVLAAQGEPSGVTEDFRQDGDFLWLTGVTEPDAWLLLSPRSKYGRTALFLRPRDPERERWTGPRAPLSPALRERYGVDVMGRGRPDRAALAAGQETVCVALIAPAVALKRDLPLTKSTPSLATALVLLPSFNSHRLIRVLAPPGLAVL